MALKHGRVRVSLFQGYYMKMQFHISEAFNEDILLILRILIDYTEYMRFITLVAGSSEDQGSFMDVSAIIGWYQVT